MGTCFATLVVSLAYRPGAHAMHSLISRFALQPKPAVPIRRMRRSSATSDDTPLVCGWFDSSHELQQGLAVHEVTGELPLPDGFWLGGPASEAPAWA
jgi:hypothetical protein